MQDFQGKTAVITGAASGIGLAMARRFASEGMNIVLADVESGALEQAVNSLADQGANCIGVPADVSRASDVQQLAEKAADTYGGVHVACNNAGVFTGGLLWEESVADYQWLMDVNVWGVIHGIRTFVPMMQAQGDDCHIVNTASMAAVTAMPYSGIYHMTKHAVLGMSESLFHELAFHAPNVKVSVLCPELIKTGIAGAERNRPEKYTRPGDIVESEARSMVMNSINEGTADGISPDVMAERVLQAIIDEQFYILSDEEWRATANVRLDDIREGRNPTFSPPIAQ